jgi:exodeoxyribonuclease VII large subunit
MNIKDEKFYKINNNLDYLAKLIINTGPEKILKRGYTYVVKNGKVISRKKLLNTNDVVGLHFYDGSLEAKINKNEQEKTRH